MNEAKLLGLIDECVENARYVEDSSSLSFWGQVPPIKDTIAVPASLWTQLVMELRPFELSREPGEAA